MIFDTHCHLYDAKYEENIEDIIKKALDNNVGLIMLTGDNILNSIKCINASLSFEEVYCSIGVHPVDVDSIKLEDLEEAIVRNINHKVKAIGEIGLDYYWDNAPETKEKQKRYFIKQIEIANKLNLPIVIHARDSVEDAINILKEYPCNKKGVFHCYSGSLEQLKIIIKMGYYIGVDGPVTYKNAINPKDIAKNVDLSKLLVETDAPYLTPVPKRGKLNYPEYLVYVIEEIANLRQMKPKDIEDITFENGKRLFNI
jgi:TatD DNase family protein